MKQNVLDNYNSYVSNLSKNIVKFQAALTGRPIVYCSLKRFQYDLDNGNIIKVNKLDTPQKEGETVKEYKKRRQVVKPLTEVLKNVYTDSVNSDPLKSISNLGEPNGLEPLLINEDYEYFRLMASIIQANQNKRYLTMDNQLQIVLPKLEQVYYKKNDKVIFQYNKFEYTYMVKEQPETYLNDIYLLQLSLMYNNAIE